MVPSRLGGKATPLSREVPPGTVSHLQAEEVLHLEKKMMTCDRRE